MAGYWNSADLTFFSGAKQTSGWQATLDRYRATYASPGHEMGRLEFSALQIEMLGPDAAFVRGAWHLTMPDGKLHMAFSPWSSANFPMDGRSSTTTRRPRIECYGLFAKSLC